MAKLALVALLALTAILAQVSAYKTIITTTTIHDDNGINPFFDGLPTTIEDNGFIWAANGLPMGDDNPSRGGGSQEQCRTQVEEQQLNHCQMHLTQTQTRGQGQEQEHLQLCCDQLRQVTEQCQCEAIQNVVQQVAQRYQQQQGGRRGSQGQGQGQQQQIQQILRKAQMLPQQCNLQSQQCPIRIPFRIPRV